ncbi:(2Fe-2S)-binding protein [Acuticoccus sediminis]|uniref:(2Fe-2S)-binding protein n=1 Tax=Acuticoccus sediminis TaxID=2184697 RepID=UPI001CFE4503|nr:(2Fe-2S)-binding protein [Acuticoccus sediminis]
MASSRSDDLVPPDTPKTPTRDGGAGFPITRRDALATGAAAAAAVPLMRAGGAAAQGEAARSPLRQGATLVRATVNGEPVEVEIDPRSSLLDVLRETLGLTGAKKGCDHGQCGACTVHVDGRRVASCLTLAAKIDGREVTTIEGLSDGDTLHPMQQAFIDHDALQCGYCTPGQIMAAVACVAEGNATSPERIREYMSGNICRCGAYVGIVAAIEDAAAKMGEG